MYCIGRYTTPVCCFDLDIDPLLLKDCLVSFSQFGNVLFHKNLSECEIEGYTLKCRLTDEETKMFNRFLVLKVQIKVLFIDGDLDNSNIINLNVDDVLDDTPVDEWNSIETDSEVGGN